MVNTAAPGSAALADGANQVADGLNQLNDNVPALEEGVSDLNAGAKQLNSGAEQVADGNAESGSRDRVPEQRPQHAVAGRSLPCRRSMQSSGYKQLQADYQMCGPSTEAHRGIGVPEPTLTTRPTTGFEAWLEQSESARYARGGTEDE